MRVKFLFYCYVVVIGLLNISVCAIWHFSSLGMTQITHTISKSYFTWSTLKHLLFVGIFILVNDSQKTNNKQLSVKLFYPVVWAPKIYLIYSVPIGLNKQLCLYLYLGGGGGGSL